MRSNKSPTPGLTARAFTQMGPMPAGPRNTIDRLHDRDRLESIARLRAAVRALDDIDLAGWDDSSLSDHLDEISASLVAIDFQLTRVAEAVRSRGFPITEPLAA